MNELELMGKNCRDIVSGFEGICIGVTEWMYGCRQFMIQPKAENGMKKSFPHLLFEKQLEILDNGISDKVEIPEYQPQQFFGKECRDKVTGVVGMCIGRAIWLFNCDQYVLEIQSEDMTKESRLIWLDDGRMDVTEEQEKAIDPGFIEGSRPGGVLDASMYPEELRCTANHQSLSDRYAAHPTKASSSGMMRTPSV